MESTFATLILKVKSVGLQISFYVANQNKYFLYPIKNKEKIDIRRKEMGMDSLDNYIIILND
jgi:hypothetical protein